ncbi:hypothetical protein PV325_010744 [Microctonus aethiopoides]|nr:hypothetical protein PV325_010744 [Microctonus aethiopoides]
MIMMMMMMMRSKVTTILGLVLVAVIIGVNCEENDDDKIRQRRRPIYSNEFAVHVPDGPEVADEIARKHGFENKGQNLLWTGEMRNGRGSASVAAESSSVVFAKDTRSSKKLSAKRQDGAPLATRERPRHRSYKREDDEQTGFHQLTANDQAFPLCNTGTGRTS